jgi:hypothetical protein
MEEIGNFADAVPEANVGNYHPKPQHDKAPGVVFLDGYLFTAPVGQFQANSFAAVRGTSRSAGRARLIGLVGRRNGGRTTLGFASCGKLKSR